MAEMDRAYIVDNIVGVDYVIIYNHPTANNCIGAIEIIKPDIFTKGGDRTGSTNTPEANLIESYGGKVIYNVGASKAWSSSDYLVEWVKFANSKDSNS